MSADFQFTSFYYTQLLEALQRFRARNVKQLPDFSPYSPESQLERMMALVGHLVNCNIGILANEMSLPTAHLVQSAINIGNTLGYPFSQYSPAVAAVVGKLSADITAQTTVLPVKSTFSANDINTGAAVEFENLTALVLYETQAVTIKYYSSLQNQYYPAPYDTTIPAQAEDCIYFGLETMFTALNFVLAGSITCVGVWEYWDGLYGVWASVPKVVDGTANLAASGEVSFTLPQQVNADWESSIIDSATRYWVRFRLTTAPPSLNLPTLSSAYPSGTGDVVDADTGDKWVKVLITQGSTKSDTFVSDGSANQVFELTNTGLVEGSLESLSIAEGGTTVTWSRVSYLSQSGPFDNYFKYVVDSENTVLLQFGDGTTGRVPPPGAVITVSYRVVPTEAGGNVPARTISGGDTGGKVLRFTNPRSAVGYSASFDELAVLKEAIPLWVSTNERAVSTPDLEYFLLNDALGTGSSPAERSHIVNEGLGLGSILVALVGAEGATIDSSVLTAIEERFNSKKEGILLVNKRLSLINYTPKHITISAKVYGGDRNALIAALVAKLHPLATRTAEDGTTTWQWDFADKVPTSVIIATLQDVVGVEQVILYQPTTDTQLATYELPLVELADISLDVRAV